MSCPARSRELRNSLKRSPSHHPTESHKVRSSYASHPCDVFGFDSTHLWIEIGRMCCRTSMRVYLCVCVSVSVCVEDGLREKNTEKNIPEDSDANATFLQILLRLHTRFINDTRPILCIYGSLTSKSMLWLDVAKLHFNTSPSRK